MVWVGGLDSWDPLMKGIVTYGRLIRIPNHRAPSHQFTLWKSSRPNKVAGLLDDPWSKDSLPMGKPFGRLGLPGLPLVYRILKGWGSKGRG